MYEQRVQLAGQGVVKSGGGTGFELFDRTNLGMTDIQEKIAKTRATEGELQRTISGLTPVQSARVHIAIPEASLYSTTQQPTTASVAIRDQARDAALRAGSSRHHAARLGRRRGAQARQRDDRRPERHGPSPVGVEDSGGLADASNALKLTQDQLVAKEKYESDLQQSLQGLLDATIGAHRSAVRVASQMNFDANSTETKSYSPQGTVRSSQSERETLQRHRRRARRRGRRPRHDDQRGSDLSRRRRSSRATAATPRSKTTTQLRSHRSDSPSTSTRRAR